MGVSQMDVFIQVIAREPVKDAEGFGTQQDIVLFSGRAYKSVTEGGSERWRNEAVFSEELTSFRLRCVPGLKITTEHFIVDEDGRYNITKVDNVSGRGMYVNLTASLIKPAKG
jgi:hypothetical protein